MGSGKEQKKGRMDAIDDIRIEPLELTENCRRVLESRYLKKDPSGKVTEAPEELFMRVAETMADVEKLYGGGDEEVALWRDRFYKLITSRRFMPNSPTLMNAGREMGMLSACFVLPVPDSIDGIFDSIKHTALIQKAGGGTGFAFDELRPTGDYIKSSGGTTSGPISFWKAFSEATNAIQQGAFRRGANMGMMYITHPDILKFLHAKQDLSQFTNYNISVKVTDEWMEGFLADPDAPHVVRNPRTGAQFYLAKELEIWKYDVRSLTPVDSDAGRNADPRTLFSRRDIWEIIVNNAHATGEPGVVFIDRINDANPTPHIGRMEATNPCGEQPLLPYEACNLGSINLGLFVDEGGARPKVDWERMREAIHVSMRFLDNVIDANNYPLPQIDAVCKANRKVGLGVMGFADALFKLGVPYNSAEGVEWGGKFMQFLNDESHNYSEKLAEERGCFPNWKGSTWDTVHHRKQRNACSTTVAPTGTISIIAGCSGGIEPLFSLAFFRNVLDGQRLVEVHEDFKTKAKACGFFTEALMERIAKEGTLAHIDEVPQQTKEVFVCAHDITPEWHMRQQAAFQAHCDASISKTINFPHEADVESVDQIYRMAFQLQCKGVTVYRDGCRDHQPMALDNADKHKKKAAKAEEEKVEEKALTPLERLTTVEPVPLPDIMSCIRIRQMTPFGNMHLKITVDPKSERELEVFSQLGKGGDVANSDLEAICRLLSLFLRCGGPLRMAIKQLDGIGSSLQVPTKAGRIASLGDGLAKGLLRYAKAKEMFGLKAMLLGEIDLVQLDERLRGIDINTPVKRVTPKSKTNGNGGNGGNGGGNGNGDHGNGDNGGSAAASTSTSSDKQAPRQEAKASSGGTGGPATAVAPALAKRQGLLSAFKIKCPQCQGVLSFQEGCVKCHSCGYSQC